MSRPSTQRTTRIPADPSDPTSTPSDSEIKALERKLTLHPTPQNILSIQQLLVLYRQRSDEWSFELSHAPSGDAIQEVVQLASSFSNHREQAEHLRTARRAMREEKRLCEARIAWLRDRIERLERVLQVVPDRPAEFRRQMQDVIPSFWVSGKLPGSGLPAARRSPAR